MHKEKTRYIPRTVRRRLLEQARARCCLSKDLLVPGEQRLKKLVKVLNKHHMVFFADGGPNTEENLIVVCPNCHALIHANPNIYTPELLRSVKQHWIGMRGVVTQNLIHPLATDDHDRGNLIEIPVVLETVNLQYSILAPKSLSVGELAQFIASNIISPLGKYDDNPAWRRPERIALAFASKPNEIIDPSHSIGDIRIESGNALAVLIHVWTQAVIGDILSLEAIPSSPREGQNYIVVVRTRPRREVNIQVLGTDGYRAKRTDMTDDSGTIELPIPGARSGVVDSISAEMSGRMASITLVFMPRLSYPHDA